MPGSRRPLVLASQSPRRIELMREAGFECEVLPVEVEESHDASLSPRELTILNASTKALAAARLRPGALVIGADTLVYLHGAPLGKPADMAAAVTMLQKLSGKAHEVCTGVCLAWDGGAASRTFAIISQVVFKTLTPAVIGSYYSRVSPLDKAGAYAIQEHGDMIVDHTEGSWTNIVGLPMEALIEELSRVDLR
jgi:septum formation protein